MGLLIKLKNGDTSLKSLKFGHDRPGGGDSNQPYIQTPIDKPNTPVLNNDFLLRGGISTPLNAAEDVTRLTKYFFDFKSPLGLLFTAKQNLLSRTAVKTEASFGLGYGGASKEMDVTGVIGGLYTGNVTMKTNNGTINEGIYTPLSTLAQAGVVAFGGHLNKQGLDPTGAFPGLSIRKYQDVAYDFNRAERNTEDPKVPLSLIRKSQRASKTSKRKVEKRSQQDLKTQQELNRGPSQINLSSFQSDTAAKNPALQKAEQSINNFLKKWDAYRDKRAQKKLSKAETAEDKAIEKSTSLFNQVEAIENSAKVYNNRLLKLWDGSGLNLSNPFSSISSVLYSYGGGPNSVLGAGKTSIKFATTNDGATPLRTNFLPSNLEIQPVNYLTTKIFGNEYSPLPGVSLLYQNSFVGSKYLTNPESLFYTGDSNSNYLEDYDEKDNIQPWVQNFVSPNKSNENPKSYLVGSQRQPERDIFTSFITVTTASIAYGNITKKSVINTIDKKGRKSWEITFDNSVYKPGTLEGRTNVTKYLTKEDKTYSDPKTRNSSSAKFTSPIISKLEDYKRELLARPVYDTTIGTFASPATSGSTELINTNIGNEVMNKMLLKTTNQTYSYTRPKTHGKGYLANLDKNSGYHYDSTGKLTFTLNQYSGGGGAGIAPDFRVTDRKTRGFNDGKIQTITGPTDTQRNVTSKYIYGSYDAITTTGTDYSDNTLDNIYYDSNNNSIRKSKKLIEDKNDLIDFSFRIVDPKTPNAIAVLVDFRAYLDSFSDSYSNNWAEQTYMGRAEKQYKYNSFDRSISLGFTVVAENRNHLEEMYRQLNTLASSIAPTYTSQGYMAGMLHRLRVGNYVWDQWGILEGLTFEVTDETPWEISQPDQLPLYIKVTGVKFKPIHNFRPEFVTPFSTFKIKDKIVTTPTPFPKNSQGLNLPPLWNGTPQKYIKQTKSFPNP